MPFSPAVELQRRVAHVVLDAFDAELAAAEVAEAHDERCTLAEAAARVDVRGKLGAAIHGAVRGRRPVRRYGSFEVEDRVGELGEGRVAARLRRRPLEREGRRGVRWSD